MSTLLIAHVAARRTRSGSWSKRFGEECPESPLPRARPICHLASHITSYAIPCQKPTQRSWNSVEEKTFVALHLQHLVATMSSSKDNDLVAVHGNRLNENVALQKRAYEPSPGKEAPQPGKSPSQLRKFNDLADYVKILITKNA